MKIFLRVIIIFIISLVSYIVVGPDLDLTILATMYNVAGVMFSIGMGLIVTFNLNGIKNREYLRAVRYEIRRVLSLYIKYFLISVLLYILPIFFKGKGIVFSIWISSIELYSFLNIVSLVYIIFSICYFIINFIEIQKIKDDIYDETEH